MKRQRKSISIVLIAASVIAASSLCLSAATFSAFSSSRKIEQGVGTSGILGPKIMLNPGVWEKDDPDYLMYVFVTKNNVETSIWVKNSGRQSDGYYVFFFQDYADFRYTEGGVQKINVIFTRMRPDRTNGSNNFDVGYCWNKTGDLKYTIGSSANICKITGWGTTWVRGGNNEGTISDTTWVSS